MVGKHKTWRSLVALLAVVTLVGGACSDDDDVTVGDGADTDEPAGSDGGDVNSLTVEATEYSFSVPESVPAGATRLELDNQGQEGHHAQVFRLNDGVTVADFQAKLPEGEAALFEVGTFSGGTGAVDPGSTSAADGVPVLEEGTYVLLCFLPAPDGQPHIAKGMVQPFEVTANEEAPAAPEPADEVGLVDFGFELPDEFQSGEAYEIVNNGQEPHEMNILDLADGATADDVLAFVSGEAQGPPPFSAVGGMQALMPGPTGRQVLRLDLDPGEYLVVCFIPSIADGQPHIAKGMRANITVS